MKVLKYSRQREAIKASLMNRCDHPTADAYTPAFGGISQYQPGNRLSELKSAGGDGRDP